MQHEAGTDNGRNPAGYQPAVDWSPSVLTNIIWQVLGVALVFVAFFGFGALYVQLTGGDVLKSTFISINFLVLITTALGVLIVHEGFHGLAALWFGGRPQFGAAMLHSVFPVFYCTVPGHLFTRSQFAVFAMAPVVGISALGVVAMIVSSPGIWLLVPLAVNFGGAIGDFWMTGLVLLEPVDTVVEDQREGLRIHRPAM